MLKQAATQDIKSYHTQATVVLQLTDITKTTVKARNDSEHSKPVSDAYQTI